MWNATNTTGKWLIFQEIEANKHETSHLLLQAAEQFLAPQPAEQQ